MKGLHFLFAFLWLNISFGQYTVTVMNDQGIPLVGANVINRDYSIQLITNIEGKATLPENIENEDQLLFSYLGYEQKSISFAELKKSNYIVIMVEGLQLDEVIVVGRAHDDNKSILNAVSQIKSSDIALRNPETAADALANSGEVYVQKSQAGGGSPVLRGFEANKVLLILDGVRMNNAIYRNGHLQNAITVDGGMLENISVIFGPGSLMYGSDALGGVVHFKTKNPKLRFGDENSISGNAYLRYSSANRGKATHLDINYGNDRWASLSSITVSDFGELRSGKNYDNTYPDFGKRIDYIRLSDHNDEYIINTNPEIQYGTAYTQYDFIQKILFQKSAGINFSLNMQYSTSSEIPRYDALTEREMDLLKWSEWSYGPQKRLLLSGKITNSNQSVLSDYRVVNLSYQNIHEDRITRRYGDKYREHQEEKVDVLTFTIDLEKNLKKTIDLKYGVEANYNKVKSLAFSEDINSGDKTSDVQSRYPSGLSDMKTLASYFTISKTLNPVSKVIFGSRITLNKLNFSYLRSDLVPWPESYYNGLSNNSQAITGSVGINTELTPRLLLKTMIATSFRSPNVDDIAKIRVKSDEVTIPNPELTSEKSINADLHLGIKLTQSSRIGATAFYTKLTDAIIRSPLALPDGSNQLIDGRDTLVTVGNINADKARVYGISIKFDASFSSKLKANLSYNWQKGRVINENNLTSPLSHIPPTYGKIGLDYAHNRLSTSIDLRYNLAKDISEYGGSEDNAEYATPEGSLGWYTLNLYSKLRLNDQFYLDAGMENILDRHYRTFASGVSAPGRNLILSIRLKF